MDERHRPWPIAALFVVYLLLAAWLPAVDDEYYYWCWSKDVQWSYYDHPPMTAVLIRLSTCVFGDSVIGFRVPACIASVFAIYVINRLTPIKPFVWGVVLTPLFAIFAVVITPDSPLILFWSAYLWWLVELHRQLTPVTSTSIGVQDHRKSDEAPGTSESTREEWQNRQASSVAFEPEVPPGISMSWWLMGGVILGCGVLSKYTMGLAVPAGFLSFILSRRPWREWLPGYISHGVVAFFVASPILIYNIGQNFEPLLFQMRHAAQPASSAWRSIGEFVGVQILAFGTIPFTLFPWVCCHVRRLRQDPRLRVCLCFYALPLAFFLYKSTNARLEANWALVSFISFWPLASDWYQTVRASRTWSWLTVAGFLPPVLSVIGILSHLIWPSPFVPIKGDRVYRQIALNRAAAEVGRKIHERGEPLPVYTDTYQQTALLRFQSLDARQIAELSRPSHFTRPPRRLTDVNRAYFVAASPLPPDFRRGFDSPQLLDSIPVIYRGETDRILHIWLFSKRD